MTEQTETFFPVSVSSVISVYSVFSLAYLENRVERVAYRAHADYFQTIIFRQPAQVVLREHYALESHSSGLAQAHRGVAGRANLSGQSHLTEDDRGLVDRDVAKTGSHRRDDPQVDSRFVQRNPSDQVDEDVVAGEVEPGAFFEHRHEQRHAIDLDPLGRAPSRAEFRRTDKRLDFDQHRARAFHRGDHRRA